MRCGGVRGQTEPGRHSPCRVVSLPIKRCSNRLLRTSLLKTTRGLVESEGGRNSWTLLDAG